MNFSVFKAAVAAQFKAMSERQLFRTAASKEDLWTTYLSSFPLGSNPIYKTRTEHDCNCCKQFIRAVGDVVAIVDGRLVSIWDVEIPSEPGYQAVANAMSALVRSHRIESAFLHYEKTAGVDKNFGTLIEGKPQAFHHFFVNIPSKFVAPASVIGAKLGEINSSQGVLLRGLSELKLEALETVLELIDQGSLYRGEEHKSAVAEFTSLKRLVQSMSAFELDLFAWLGASTPSARFRNTVIGTLVTDLSEGVKLEHAVKSFEVKVAPTNYKRPTALVTKAQVEKARQTIEELGLTSALERRYAHLADIKINNVLWADRGVKVKLNPSVFDDLAGSVPEKIKSFDKVEEISIDKFLTDVLPTAERLEVMMENGHAGRLVSLIAPVDPTAQKLFKWPNLFSWTYAGDVADSIKERVKNAGGSVVGDLCCRLAWDYNDDLDFHMYEPDGGHIYFSNRRSLSSCGGKLDVDANGGDGLMKNPVENIFYANRSRMAEGIYKLVVNNYYRRSDGVGFEVEIEFGGKVFNIAYDKVLKVGQSITVAQIEYTKAEGFKILESLPTSGVARQLWGVTTNTFTKVGAVMHSPNFWDGLAIGNKHVMFMLEGCKNEDVARGFYNEFLDGKLDQHRKVLEMVGSRLKTEVDENQLSGLGFSSTQRDSMLCRVTGKFTRVVKVIF